MPVYYTGGVGDIEGTYAFAHRNGLRVIEDAAHAFGTRRHGKRVGSFGDISCFSFDGIKNITSGEGGCILTTDEQVLQRVRDARLLGVEKDSEKRYLKERSWEFDVSAQGWRYHMSNIMAAIGIEQLKRFSELASRRCYLAKRYDSILKNHERIFTLPLDYDDVVPHIYVVRIQGLKNQSSLREKMLESGIQTGKHYQPNHELTYYRDDSGPPLPVTDSLIQELLTLPLHPDLREGDQDYICEKLIEFIHEC
jgi:dTDP-4-amino-4,6-dideoxygalactose transaminase